MFVWLCDSCDYSDVRKKIGYCPQFDALLPMMTARVNHTRSPTSLSLALTLTFSLCMRGRGCRPFFSFLSCPRSKCEHETYTRHTRSRRLSICLQCWRAWSWTRLTGAALLPRVSTHVPPLFRCTFLFASMWRDVMSDLFSYVSRILDRLTLTAYADKPCKGYSGGNKVK